MTTGYQLPAQPTDGAALRAEGFLTPTQDTTAQCANFLPRRVLPVVFLPGIMGSNLKLSAARQSALRKKNNIAWRPDSAADMFGLLGATAADRQLLLDPLHTSVDIYEPAGPRDVSGDRRHGNVKLARGFDSPLLKNDPPAASSFRTATQKARARGWGEVFFNSYGQLLQHLEARLNNTFSNGRMHPAWADVVGVDPAAWQLDARFRGKADTQPLNEDALRKFATGCWFPVHAIGYNWLESNSDSADIVAARIEDLMAEYADTGYQCEEVILVTHSMGGLLGRALIHPDLGALGDKVLGIVHGVMPAMGAPAAYKRMRAGFEDPGLLSGLKESVAAKLLGNYGDEVTAVLGNAPGGLELLPSEIYPGKWLRVTHRGKELGAWPQGADPYQEIYRMRGAWYSLLREEWINPSNLRPREGGGTIERTCGYLDRAKQFHGAIADTYHSCSYAHYGADSSRSSFGTVSWEIDPSISDTAGWQDWSIHRDDRQGRLHLVKADDRYTRPNDPRTLAMDDLGRPPQSPVQPTIARVTLAAPDSPGDQTVPACSADHQLNSGKFLGVFRQNGYEHQDSYKDERAIACTLYSIVRIALRAHWRHC